MNLKRSLLVLVLAAPVFSGLAASSIDLVNRYAYGANFGWTDAVADNNNGAVIGAYYCWGNIYSANVGWINLRSGSPANIHVRVSAQHRL
jgi:hypothetical protein